MSAKIALLCVSVALVVVAACPAPKNGGEGESGEGEGAAAGEGEGEGACGTDALLGSLAVGSNYLLAGGQGLPVDILDIAIGDLGSGTPELLGLTADLHVVDLGTYPGSVPAIPPVLFDVLAPADQNLDRASDVFPSFLVASGTSAAAGYTRKSDQGGNVAVTNLVENTTSYTNAPGDFAAAFRGDGTVLVESDGFGTAGTNAFGVYWSSTQSLLIGLGASAIANGNLAVAKSGVLVAGRFIDPDAVFADGKNELFAISSSKADAIAAGTGSFDMESATPFYSGQDLNGVAWGVSAFHDGIAQVAVDASFAGIKVTHTALADDGTSVTASTPDDVVTGGSAACTTISFVASFNDDLLVGVQDAAGHRLIQIHAK